LWSLFAAHLAVEKILKAAVVSKTGEHAPPVHNLLCLAHGAGVVLMPEQEDFLAELNRYNIEAGYPRDREALRSACDREHTVGKINEAREFVRWIRQRF